MTLPAQADIVERLLSSASRLDYAGDGLGYYTRADAIREREAAATISRLTADNEALRAKLAEAMEILRPFADRCDDLFNDWCPDETPAWHLSDENDPPSPITVGEFRAARRLVEEGNHG